MVAQREPHYMTLDEYHELMRKNPDAKYEYIDGQAYLMAGGTANHARISTNVVRQLEDAPGDGLCAVYNSDLSVRLSESCYFFPDATVTCDESDQGEVTAIRSPRVVVEVLSDSTEGYDRGRKFAYYRQCPTLEEYVLVATDHQAVEVFRCTEHGWTAYHAYSLGDTVELVSIGVHIPVAAFYRRTTVKESFETYDSREM